MRNCAIEILEKSKSEMLEMQNSLNKILTTVDSIINR
jgi:hypothetical protein